MNCPQKNKICSVEKKVCLVWFTPKFSIYSCIYIIYYNKPFGGFERLTLKMDEINSGGNIRQHSVFKSELKTCELPVVLYKEEDEYVAECPIFYVASHGTTEDEAIDRVKEALKLYLSDEQVQESIPEAIDCSDEAILKKSEELFYEYNGPDEKLPDFVVKRVVICVH